jgi:uncharacterized NAD(P)/FAD-binding protein YdhS
METAGINAKPTIAIVGAGFSGSLVAIHLLRMARASLRILLIEREGAPGHGIAYRKQPDCHLLNVRASAMSAFVDDPDDFVCWLKHTPNHSRSMVADQFMPRRLYGDYIQNTLQDAIAAASPGVSLEIHQGEAIDLKLEADQLKLKLDNGACLHANHVVLALGNPGPADLPAADAKLLSDPRYCGRAWSPSTSDAVRPQENLLLVGSGLTTLDWLVGLHDRGHQGRIHVLSRRGLLPNEHRAAPPHALSFDPIALPAHLRTLLRRLRAEAAAVQQQHGDWRSVIDALRPVTQALWQGLPRVEKQRFLRHLRPLWEVHRHRAAPSVLRAVHTLRARGQLQLLAGRLQALTPQHNVIAVLARLRGNRGEWRIKVDRVINCTGPECDYRRLNHPLIAALLAHHLICADELGLGLNTDAEGALLDAQGRASSQLFTLGPPRKGQLWETTAVAEIRQQAPRLARHLLDRLGLRSGAPSR